MTLRVLLDYVMLTIGCALAATGLALILAPNQLVDGGVTACAIMLSSLTGWSTGGLFLALNTPALLFGMRTLGRRFFIRSLYCNAVVALLLMALATWQPVTSSELLIVLYGGALLGLGLGVVVRNGAAVDGTEVLAVWFHQRFRVPVSTFLMTINGVILTLAAFVFSLEQAMLSVAVFFIVSRLVDFVLEGINRVVSITVISSRPEAICAALTEEMALRLTILHGEGGFTGAPLRLIYCVTDRMNYVRVRQRVYEIDPAAIIEASIVHEAEGVSRSSLSEHVAERVRQRRVKTNTTNTEAIPATTVPTP